MVKSLTAMRETRVGSLGWEDPLEKDMATHSSILAWRIPWTEEPGGLQSMGSQRVEQDLVTKQQQTSCQYVSVPFHREGRKRARSREVAPRFPLINSVPGGVEAGYGAGDIARPLESSFLEFRDGPTKHVSD